MMRRSIIATLLVTILVVQGVQSKDAHGNINGQISASARKKEEGGLTQVHANVIEIGESEDKRSTVTNPSAKEDTESWISDATSIFTQFFSHNKTTEDPVAPKVPINTNGTIVANTIALDGEEHSPSLPGVITTTTIEIGDHEKTNNTLTEPSQSSKPKTTSNLIATTIAIDQEESDTLPPPLTPEETLNQPEEEATNATEEIPNAIEEESNNAAEELEPINNEMSSAPEEIANDLEEEINEVIVELNNTIEELANNLTEEKSKDEEFSIYTPEEFSTAGEELVITEEGPTNATEELANVPEESNNAPEELPNLVEELVNNVEEETNNVSEEAINAIEEESNIPEEENNTPEEITVNAEEELTNNTEEEANNPIEEPVNSIEEEPNNVTEEEVNNATEEEVNNATEEEVNNVTEEEVNNATEEEVNNATEEVNNSIEEVANNDNEEEVNNAIEEPANTIIDELNNAAEEESNKSSESSNTTGEILPGGRPYVKGMRATVVIRKFSYNFDASRIPDTPSAHEGFDLEEYKNDEDISRLVHEYAKWAESNTHAVSDDEFNNIAHLTERTEPAYKSSNIFNTVRPNSKYLVLDMLLHSMRQKLNFGTAHFLYNELRVCKKKKLYDYHEDSSRWEVKGQAFSYTVDIVVYGCNSKHKRNSDVLVFRKVVTGEFNNANPSDEDIAKAKTYALAKAYVKFGKSK